MEVDHVVDVEPTQYGYSWPSDKLHVRLGDSIVLDSGLIQKQSP